MKKFFVQYQDYEYVVSYLIDEEDYKFLPVLESFPSAYGLSEDTRVCILEIGEIREIEVEEDFFLNIRHVYEEYVRLAPANDKNKIAIEQRLNYLLSKKGSGQH